MGCCTRFSGKDGFTREQRIGIGELDAYALACQQMAANIRLLFRLDQGEIEEVHSGMSLQRGMWRSFLKSNILPADTLSLINIRPKVRRKSTPYTPIWCLAIIERQYVLPLLGHSDSVMN
jgi:hypothetical protein